MPSGNVKVCRSPVFFRHLILFSVTFRKVVSRVAHGDQSVQRRFVVFFWVKLNRWVEVDCEIVGLLIVIVSLLLCEA